MYPVLKLACPDARKMGFFVNADSNLMGPGIFAVLAAYSAECHHKAFSTDSSHVTIVILFFAPVTFVYMRPATTFPKYLHCCAQLSSPCLTLLSTHSQTCRWETQSGKFGALKGLGKGRQWFEGNSSSDANEYLLLTSPFSAQPPASGKASQRVWKPSLKQRPARHGAPVASSYIDMLHSSLNFKFSESKGHAIFISLLISYWQTQEDVVYSLSR